MRIKEVMNKAIAVEHDISLRQAAKIMSEKNIGSLIAVKGQKIVGIITEHDITANISNLDKKISSVMAKKTHTVNPEQDLDEAALIMKNKKIKRLPVVKDDRLVGVISATDLIAYSEDISDEFFFG